MAEAYSIPGHVRDYIIETGYDLPDGGMAHHISEWLALYRSEGEFWDYEELDGRSVYRMHRRTIRPFKRVCVEWSSLILGDETRIGTDDECCNEWLDAKLPSIGFLRNGQALLQRAFALGTGYWAVWVNTEAMSLQVRRFDARMVVPLSWDDDGVSEVALCTRVWHAGKPYDQVQMHVLSFDGYHITTACFDENGDEVQLEGVLPDLPTHSFDPWFAIVRPAIDNDLVDMSPYGVSVYKDAVDALKAVDTAYDAMLSEVDLGKLRIFLSDGMFEVMGTGGEMVSAIPFGRNDATVYRQGNMGGDQRPIYDYAPALRTEAQAKVYRISLQTMGDLCGFGLGYFDIDDAGGLKTATEVSADNSQLMRNLRNHEAVVQGAVEAIVRALIQAAPLVGEELPDPGRVTMKFDDSIITDTAAEKAQDMAEVAAGIMAEWEYRVKWYGEDEATARANAPGGVVEAPALMG